jgi:CO/xanthine dehydrogenase Mo-binding subunit
MEGGRMSIVARIADDGTVELHTAIPDQGAGAHTAIARICAATLGIGAHMVNVVQASTADAPPDIGVGASRVTFLAGRATQEAAVQLRQALENAASSRTEPPSPVHWMDGAFRSEDGHQVATWEEITKEPTVRGLSVTGSFDSTAAGHGVADFSFAALGVVVNADAETGTWTINDAVVVADTGTVVSPVAHAGQLNGGFAHGLGAARMEELVIVDGQVTNAGLADYCIPAPLDVPHLRHRLIEDAAGPGAFGSKSAGELTPSAVAPAVGNALRAKLGIRLTQLPMTPERVLRALEDRARD